jgi:hypothetical protein
MEEQFVFKHVRKNNSYVQSDEYTNDTEIAITLNGEQNLTQVLEAFKRYLQAVGFCLKMDDRIDVVNDFENHDRLGLGPGFENHDRLDSGTEESWEGSGPGHEEFSLVHNGGYNTELQEYDTTSGKDLDESESEYFLDKETGTVFKAQEDNPFIDSAYTDKLTALENEILPFLETLKQNPEKAMLRWPNRAADVEKKLLAIRDILGE